MGKAHNGTRRDIEAKLGRVLRVSTEIFLEPLASEIIHFVVRDLFSDCLLCVWHYTECWGRRDGYEQVSVTEQFIIRWGQEKRKQMCRMTSQAITGFRARVLEAHIRMQGCELTMGKSLREGCSEKFSLIWSVTYEQDYSSSCIIFLLPLLPQFFQYFENLKFYNLAS